MIGQDTIRKIAAEYGTPSFVFDEEEVIGRVREIRNVFSGEGGSASKESAVKLCYSIKANPFLIPALLPETDHLEVCSPGELQICMAQKVPGDQIIYSGVNKGPGDIREAVAYGAGILTAESPRHFAMIRDAAEEQGKQVQVLLRLTAQSQFGMSREDIGRVLSEYREKKGNVRIVGIHYFAGTQRKKLKHQAEELKMLREYVTGLREEYDLPLPKLEYGPGLPFPYFEGEDFSDTLAPAGDLAEALREAAQWCDLTVEMGRFIAGSCGHYLTSVSDVKHDGDKIWCIVDGGINHVNYLGQMMGMKVPVTQICRDGIFSGRVGGDASCGEVSHSICGSLCTTNDVLIRDYVTAPLKVGDMLVFENIGAYSITEGMGLFLSRNLPKVVLCRGDRISLARDVVETWKINM